MVDFEIEYPTSILLTGSICQMSGIGSNSIDLAYSRSVMEHLEDAETAFSEIYKVLKPNGRYIFLTPNFWDYASLMAYVIPNRLHAKIVRLSEARSEEDTFLTYYRSNTYYGINRLAKLHSLTLSKSEYLGQYPNYLIFSKTLFSIASRYEKFLEYHSRLQSLRDWIYASCASPPDRHSQFYAIAISVMIASSGLRFRDVTLRLHGED